VNNFELSIYKHKYESFDETKRHMFEMHLIALRELRKDKLLNPQPTRTMDIAKFESGLTFGRPN
jgi:hypothetical protein